ncbi:uncharacterized protein si:ch73-52p7.1 [Megalops cyprinoides]|uniref:uncharacterized protein si:ch73-52p7.1 n=1 Tax=Megalops cyprinoides TaxID=118141 RepID=UPI0018641212|nr:uncharacterized protein si:ch73-52p7.1 [Megalops cyprinoides]
MAWAGRVQTAALLGCVLWLAAPVLLRSDFRLAYVTEHSLYTCKCVQGMAPCGVINSSQCECKDHPFSVLRRPDGSGILWAATEQLTVWYTSPLNVALLLNNSEVRHLSLVKCNSVAGKAASYDYFTVQRLERLTVSYPSWRPGQSHDITLGRDDGPAYQEKEARMAIIATAVLTGKSSLKAYTVQTKVDGKGMFPFPYLSASKVTLPEASSMYVTFLY